MARVEIQVVARLEKITKQLATLNKTFAKIAKSANFNQAALGLNNVAKSASNVDKSIKNVEKSSASLSATLKDVAKQALGFGAGITAFEAIRKGIEAIKFVAFDVFADFETGLVGVGKTTNIAGQELANLGQDIRDLSREIPVSTNELLGIAQAAGQLGVTGSDNILKFSDTIAKLGVASDLSGEQAATTLTRILTVTGEGAGTIDRFASVIVALGNNFAATESEIASVTQRVAQQTAQFGVSSAQAAGLAAALKSVGVEAEVGGSVIGQAFQRIDLAIRKGGKSLTALTRLTGLTGEQLRETFEKDSTEVFRKLVNGLNGIQKSGGSTAIELGKLGLSGIRVNQVFGAISGRSDELNRALALANKEAANATALNEEAAKAFDTVASRAQRLFNVIRDVALTIGSALAPALSASIDLVTSFLEALNPSRVRTFGIALTAAFVVFRGGRLVNSIKAASSELLTFFAKGAAGAKSFAASIKLSTIAVNLFKAAATLGLTLILDGLIQAVTETNNVTDAFKLFAQRTIGFLSGVARAILNLVAKPLSRVISLISKDAAKSFDGLSKSADAALGEFEASAAAAEKRILGIEESTKAAAEATRELATAGNDIQKAAADSGAFKLFGVFELKGQNLLSAFNKTIQDGVEAQGKSIEEQEKIAQLQQQNFNFLKNAGAGLLQGADGAKGAVSNLAGFVANTFFPGLGGIATQIFSFLAMGPEAVRQFVEGFILAIPDIIVGFIEALPVLIEALIESLPVVIESLLEQLAESLPVVVGKLIGLIPRIAIQFGIALAAQAPIIALKFVIEFIKNIPKIITEFVKQIGKAVAGIFKNLFKGIGSLFGFQQGGEIPPLPQFKNDGGLARVSAGETVIPADLTTSLKRLASQGGLGQQRSGPMNINLSVGEQELANVQLNLNERGFRTVEA